MRFAWVVKDICMLETNVGDSSLCWVFSSIKAVIIIGVLGGNVSFERDVTFGMGVASWEEVSPFVVVLSVVAFFLSISCF